MGFVDNNKTVEHQLYPLNEMKMTALNVKQVTGLHGAYMVWVCVGCVVQDHGLGEIPPEDAEIFDVVAENTGAIFLV